MKNSARVRPWTIVMMLAGLSLMSYVLRMNISIASKFMMPEFGLSQIQMGQVFASFMLGYALFQMPVGLLGDRWGPRVVLAFAGVSWGIMTCLTSLFRGVITSSAAAIFACLLLIRFCVGAGEAATYPVAARAIANWIQPSDRALKNAVVIAGATVGAAVTPPLISWLMVHYGWRLSFYVTGATSLVLALIWWIEGADSPQRTSPPSPRWGWLRIPQKKLHGKQCLRTKTYGYFRLDTCLIVTFCLSSCSGFIHTLLTYAASVFFEGVFSLVCHS